MGIQANLDTFFGHDVVEFDAGDELPDPSTKAVRLAIRYDGPVEEFSELWAEFMATDGVENTEVLIVGNLGRGRARDVRAHR